jgi:integrase
MPRAPRGAVIRKETALGTSYALRLRYRGRRIYHHLGGAWEGWTEERVETERAYIAAQMARGEYVAPGPPAPRPSASPAPAEGGPRRSFQEFASIVLARKQGRVADKTYADLKWRLVTAMDHFGHYRLDAITEAVVDDFVSSKLRERKAIEEAAAAGTPLTEEYVDRRTGRRHTRRRRGLSNSSINKVVAGIRQVLKEAKRHGLIERNPAEDRACYLRAPAPRRSFLELVEIDALFAAARALEERHRGLGWTEVRAIRASHAPATHLAREYEVSDTLIRKIRRREIWVDRPERNRNDVPRLAIVATLVLAGLRISELCALDGRHVDLASRVIRVPRVKTDASERVIAMLPALHELLLAHRGDYGYGPHDPVFATRNGSRNTPDNVRARIVRAVHQEADGLLARAGRAPIAQLTPHTLRRTFASLLAELGVSPRRAMYLLGHTDPKLTMGVYQQVLDMGAAAVEALERAVGCTSEEAFQTLGGRAVWPPIGHPAEKMLSRAARQ